MENRQYFDDEEIEDEIEPEQDNNLVILEEDVNPDWEPNQQEIEEYALYLGMDIDQDQKYFYIAEQGLKAALPLNWKPAENQFGEIFYVNVETEEIQQDHPNDIIFKQKFVDAKTDKSNKPSKLSMKLQGFINDGSGSNFDKNTKDVKYSDTDQQFTDQQIKPNQNLKSQNSTRYQPNSQRRVNSLKGIQESNHKNQNQHFYSNTENVKKSPILQQLSYTEQNVEQIQFSEQQNISQNDLKLQPIKRSDVMNFSDDSNHSQQNYYNLPLQLNNQSIPQQQTELDDDDISNIQQEIYYELQDFQQQQQIAFQEVQNMLRREKENVRKQIMQGHRDKYLEDARKDIDKDKQKNIEFKENFQKILQKVQDENEKIVEQKLQEHRDNIKVQQQKIDESEQQRICCFYILII